MIPYGRQSISEDDIECVEKVLRSDFLTQGKVVEEFETSFADACGSTHAVAVSNATAALHLACLAAGVVEDDEVWTSPVSFVASANCALYCGAKIDFVDIDPYTGNMDSVALEEKLTASAAAGKKPKALIPVHLGGEPCDMAAIASLAREHGIRIIEDASHAVGSRYKGRPVGSCEFSDIAVFSFHPVKVITTGEGGMALTQDSDIAERMRLLREHGITRSREYMSTPSEAPWYYEQIALGFNYRITDIQCALGLSQLKRLKDFISARHAIAERYDAMLKGLPLRRLQRETDSHSALHLYIILLDDADRHRNVFEALREAGIGVQLHYIPIHLHPYYRSMGFKPGDYPSAEEYYSRAISLPMYPTLTKKSQDYVVESLIRILR